MDKVKIIDLVGYILALVWCIGLMISFAMEAFNVAYFYFLSLVLFVPLYIWRNRVAEKNNPLSIRNLKEPFFYIYENRGGTKDEFVAMFGLDVYEYFLRNTYIHQLSEYNKEKGDYCWETTKLGMRTKVDLYS